MAKRKRRVFTPEFKADAVRLCQVGDRSLAQVAAALDLTETAVREWVKRAEIDADKTSKAALTSPAREELHQLPRDNKRLLMEREKLENRRPSSRRRTREVRVHRRGAGDLAHRSALRAARRLARRVRCE